MKPFDATGAFRPTANGESLRRQAIRSAGITVFSQTLGFAIQMIATVVLARLLAPADFGVVAMVTTVSLLFMNVGLNGFTEAVLQRQEMDHGLASNVFWICAGTGLLLTVGFAATGPLLARFYGEPRVALVTIAIALTIFITSLSVQHLALLMRAMQFSAVALNSIIARAISVVVSIVFAWAGWGYWALVAGTIALPLALCAGAWVLCRWVPGLPRRRVGTGPVVRFAVNTYARFAANYFTRNFDNLLIGWQFGSQPLGFYKKAYDLFVLPANQLSAPLTSVAVSTLSRLRDADQQRRYLLRAIATLALVGMWLGANLTLVGDDLIFVLLGPQWAESARIFKVFGPGIGMMLLYGTHGWIHLSLGRPDRWLRWGAVEFGVTALLFLAALPWGPAGIAIAWVVSFWVLTIPALWYAGQPASLKITAMIDAVWKYVVASLVAGYVCALLVHAIPLLAPAPGIPAAIGRIAATSLLFGLLYVGAVIVCHRGLAPLRQIQSLLADMLVRRRTSGEAMAVTPTP